MGALDMARKPTIPEVAPLLRAYLQAHPYGLAGGGLHTVLSDGNVHDDSVQFCLRAAREAGDEATAQMAEILLRMSRTQRSKLAGMSYALATGRV